jgi:DNA-directed RNA polymerase subunit E'/Rpb7
MKTVITTTKSIAVSPNFIDSNILKNVFSLLKKKYEKTCDEADGMILSIDKVLKIENLVSKDSCYINFDITFLATVIKPEKGIKLTFKPSYILQHKGVFGKIYDNISIFVPENTMKNWKYSNDSYISNVNGSNVINKDSTIEVIVDEIKFNSTKYNCVCSLS